MKDQRTRKTLFKTEEEEKEKEEEGRRQGGGGRGGGGREGCVGPVKILAFILSETESNWKDVG